MRLKRYTFIIVAIVLIVAINMVLAVAGEEPAPVEIIEARTRNSKTYALGGDSYALDLTLGSIHYKDDPDDPGELWKDIDTTITNSTRLEWDWEVVKGNWHLLINDDTTVALGKSGHWLAFRYIAFGYLDWASKDYVILQTREDVTPVLDGNRITWPGIFYGATLEYIYTPDGFKENLYITQQTRDWLSDNPPSSFGLDNATSYLVGLMRCDWQSAYAAEREDGSAVNWTNAQEFVGSGVFWRHPIKNKIVTALPIGYAYHEGLAEDDWVKIRYRFFTEDGYHYLGFGARVLDLNAMPPGTIVIDPTVDEQVGASSDDCLVKQATPYFSLDSLNFNAGDITSTIYDYESGARFTGVDIAQGSTITDAWISLYTKTTSGSIPTTYIECENTDDAATFSDLSDYNGRSRTSAISWTPPLWGAHVWRNSDSIVTPVQTVINRGGWSSGNDMVIFWRDASGWGGSMKSLTAHSYDDGDGPKLHIEYTAAAAPAGWSWGQVIG